MNAALLTACDRLLGATATGVYQGVLVTAVGGLALRLFPRTNAATRHAVWFGVLFLVAALIPAHLVVSSLPRPKSSPTSIQTAAAVLPVFQEPPDATASPVWRAPIPEPRRFSRDDSEAGGLDGAPNGSAAGLGNVWTERERNLAGQPRAGASEKVWWKFAAAKLRPKFQAFEAPVRLPHWLGVCAISVWILLTGLRVGFLAGALREVRRAKIHSAPPSQALQKLFERLCASLAVRRKVRLRLSGAHHNAVLLGFSHPVVLLPEGMDEEAGDAGVEHVLRHELAHVVRRDDWANLAQQLVQAALFFHPAVWWISARLSLEREFSCDDHVLAAAARSRDYALTLANLAGRTRPGGPLLSPGVSANHSQLQERIAMILNTDRNRSPRLAQSRLGFFTTTAAMLAALAIGAGPRLVVAQTQPGALPVAPTADGTPAALPTDATVETGPRTKPGGGSTAFAPTPAAAPVAPEAPAPAPAPPTEPAGPGPEPRPASAGVTVARPRKHDASIEERLSRIERMVEKLAAREGIKDSSRRGVNVAANVNVDADVDAKVNNDANAKWKAEARREADAMQHEADAMRREAEARKREAEAGQREADRAIRDMMKQKNKDFERMQENLNELESEAPMKALQALRTARETLAKQMQVLQRQIDRLEADQSRPKYPNPADDSGDAQKP